MEFRAGKIVFYGKKVVSDSREGLCSHWKGKLVSFGFFVLYRVRACVNIFFFFYLASAFIFSHLHIFIKKTSISQKDHIRLIGFPAFYFLFIYLFILVPHSLCVNWSS